MDEKGLTEKDVKLLRGVADAAGVLYDRLVHSQTDRRGHPSFTQDQAFELVKAAMPTLARVVI
jgi:hypothetical protein